MKREVGVSVFAVLILAVAILSVYYLNLRTTGFAVFQQGSQSDFDEGTYSNVVYDSNASAVVLNANETAGTYTSKVFDSGNNGTTWNNLTWQGNGSFTFEARVCSLANCSDANFSSVANLNNLNLSGNYFQYKAMFDSSSSNETLALESISVDYSVPVAPVVTSVSISQPSGTIDSRESVPLQYTTTGTGLQCWYNIRSPDGTEFIANTTPSACADSDFDLSSDGDYIITVYANGSSGFASQESGFLISTTPENEPEEEPEELPVQEIPVQQPEIQSVTQASLGDVPRQEMIQGSSRELTLSLQNTGTVPLTSCVLTGDDSGFITTGTESVNIAAGANANFAFSLNVPEETLAGEYALSMNVGCAEIIGSKSVTLNVLQKKLDFNITNVQRTRQNRVSVDYIITELAGEDQDLEIFFSIKDSSGVEVANASQNRSIDANETDDFRTNIAINETINGTMTLSASFNSAIYSSSVLEPISLGAVTGGAIFGGVGAGSLVVVLVVVIVLAAVFFVARKLRKSGKLFGSSGSDKED